MNIILNQREVPATPVAFLEEGRPKQRDLHSSQLRQATRDFRSGKEFQTLQQAGHHCMSAIRE